MPYKEIRADYSLTLTTSGIDGQRSYIQHDATSCSIEDLPNIGDPFSVAYPTCKLRSITAKPYHIDHSLESEDKNQYKYVCIYSTQPNSSWVNENNFGDRYTGGTSVISLDLKEKGSQWFWVKTKGDTDPSQQILKRNVFFTEAKGTYTKVITVPRDETDTFYSWGTFLTGDGGPDGYGINNSLGKLNSVVESVNSGAFDTDTNKPDPWPYSTTNFKIGQLLFTSYDCEASVSETGIPIFIVRLNFAHRVVDLDTNNKNVSYPWLYLVNDQKQLATDPDYQLVIKNKTSYTGSENPEVLNDVFLYNWADFGTTLNPLKS